MRMSKQCVIFSLLILSTCYVNITMAQNSPCGDWEPYKDEKCIKVIDETRTYDDAIKTCQQQANSSILISIRSSEEQEFFSNLLFKTHKVVDAVWIGAKYISNKFKWVDDIDVSFTNWAEGSPSNTTDKACVQMIAEGSSIGKWADEPCNKKNLVVCQKMQPWTLSLMQKTLLDARKELNDTLEDLRKQINNQQSTISKQQTTINSHQSTIDNLKQNPVPIGFIYVQLPSEKSPTEIWPWMTWNDVSSTYAGVFFRVIGGGAASFGQLQGEFSPHISKVDRPSSPGQHLEYYNGIDLPTDGWSYPILTGGPTEDWTNTLRFYVSGGEVRPRNMAICIWKRSG